MHTGWSDAHQAVPELGSFASSGLLAAPGSPVARQARERPATAAVLEPTAPRRHVQVDPEYLGSLMILVALVLGVGFSILVLLALFLCLVITCMQPVNRPSNAMRLVVIAASCSLAISAGLAVTSNRSFASGLDQLLNSTAQLHTLTSQARAGHPLARCHKKRRGLSSGSLACQHFSPPPPSVQVGNATAAFYETTLGLETAVIGAHEACMLCVVNETSGRNATGGNSSGNSTDEINATDCGVLTWAARLASLSADGLARDVSKADPQITAVRTMLTKTTGWHQWATTLPLFALTCTAVAVVGGTIAGRRNLLVLAQFCSVIVWWMTCAVVSVEFAISVGMSDACVDPVATMLRVLRTIAAGSRSSEPSPRSMWLYNVSGHYIMSCSVTDPLQSSLGTVLTGIEVMNATLAQLSTDCGADPSFAVLQQAGAVVLSEMPYVLDGVGGCGGTGPVGELFRDGVGDGLCVDMANGVIGVFAWQALSGVLLLVLSLLLPLLWHSHLFPPMTCHRPRIRQWFQMTEEDTTEMSSEDDAEEEPSLQPLEAAPPTQGLDDADAGSSSTDLPVGGETTTGALPTRNLLTEPSIERRDSVCSDISTHEVL